MHSDGFFFQAFVYLTAAVVSVPIAKRLGLGSVLGYLIAGVVIGPFALGLVGEEGQDVMHFAEFGVVMMLFLVGLELQPSLLWRLRASILGMGGLQVGLTALVIGLIALFAGLSWQMALATGLILALSSTAIVLQSLNEKGLMKTQGGQSCFSVLLFQDIAVIPMLAVIPLLAVAGANHDAAAAGHSGGISALPGWQQALIVFALIAAIIVGGRLLMAPIFRFIAATRLREIFTAAALLLVIGIALAMQSVGLSPALGTFLAGVVLAESEYRHELESDIEPFKGLLLGLFFISVGASIDFNIVQEQPVLLAVLLAALALTKLAVLFIIGRIFRLPASQNFLFSFALAQGGEFAFVLFSFATQNNVLSAAVAGPLVVVVALSMALTPLLMIINDKLVQPRFAQGSDEERQADVIDEENPVIIAGFGRFGNVVGRLLRANGVPTTVLDLDPEQIDTLRRFGLKVFYGDAGRLDLLHAAGVERARLLILAIDEPERTNEIAAQLRHHFPHLKILARANSLHHAYELADIGVDQVFRETYDTALSMGIEALKELGFRAYQAHRAAHRFKKHEQETFDTTFALRDDHQAYMAQVRERIGELDSLMQSDDRDFGENVDHAWEAAAPTEDP
jgi:monovalent cation:proton antiporter-2 (CPA2) family protein